MSPLRNSSKHDHAYRGADKNYSGTRLGASQSNHSASGHLITSSAPRSTQKAHLVDLMSHMKRGSH